MSAISFRVEVELGKTPEQCIADCIVLARRMGIPVRFKHNGIEMKVDPTDSQETAEKRFEARRDRFVSYLGNMDDATFNRLHKKA